MTKLHIGCFNVILKDWVNMDIYKREEAIVQHDARGTFPYKDNSVDFMYSEHFIEHLDFTEGTIFLKEAYRILKPGGVIRTSTFDIDDWIINLNPNNPETCEKFKDTFYNGMFKHLTRIELFNLAVFDSDASHKHMFNTEELIRLLTLSGFSKFNEPKMRESEFTELKNLEWRENSNCIVEAIK